jgi:RNA polymerase sigma-70 factor (ECF subfamily)
VDTEVIAGESTELDLVRRARNGDREAFSRLVKCYQKRVVSVAYRLLGNTEDACDVAQDAFVRAYRGLPNLQDAARFGPWLMKVVSNLALNFRRSRRRRTAASLDPAAEPDPDMQNPGSGRRMTVRAQEQEDSLASETRDAIQDALGQLPEKQRLALVLFSVEGMKQTEVAEVLECSVELVKWNVFQARRKLKTLLADYL